MASLKPWEIPDSKPQQPAILPWEIGTPAPEAATGSDLERFQKMLETGQLKPVNDGSTLADMGNQFRKGLVQGAGALISTPAYIGRWLGDRAGDGLDWMTGTDTSADRARVDETYGGGFLDPVRVGEAISNSTGIGDAKTGAGGYANTVGQAADDTVRFLANGMTLGFADQLAGYLGGEGTEAERQKTADAKERAGLAGDVAELVGTLLPVGAVAKSPIAATRFIPKSATGLKGLAYRSLATGADGSLIGGIQAIGNGTDPLTGALIGLGAGIGGNVAGEALTAGASKALGAFNKQVPVMSADELKTAGEQAFTDARNAGVIFKPQGIDRIRQAAYADMAEKGFHPKLQPGAATVYDELERLVQGGNVDLRGLKTLREIASGGFIPGNAKNNAMISDLVRKIDDFAESATPADVLTGNSQAASAALKQARDYWSRFRKLEKVDELLERAGLNAGSTGSGGNVENATRQQLKRLLTDKKLSRGFTANEKDALRKAVLGTPAQNALRLAGKLSPQGNGLMLALQGGLTAVNPWIGIPAMAAGYGAKKTAEAMTGRNAELVKKLIAAGGSKSALEGPKNALQRLAESQRKTIINTLLAGGLLAGGK